MSRNNNVRGPTSALTEFLKEQGITATTIARRAATRQTQQRQPEAGPSRLRTVHNVEDNEDDAGSPMRRTRRRASAKGDDNNDDAEYASDHLDESEDEKPAAKKRKLTKAQQAKADAKAKAQAKKKAKKDAGVNDSEDEDPYSAVSMWGSSAPKPNPGSFEKCAKCEKQFTVTKYTQASKPGPGFLCQPCTKAAGIDPFKKAATPRKRKPAADKRQLATFEENRFPSLASMCIKLVSKHIDDVEALGDIGTMNMDSISKAISRNRSLTSENVHLFYNINNEALTFYDATNLDGEAFSTLALLNPSINTLRLDFCGRINDTAMDTWSKSLHNLTHLELLGPFLVRSAAWQSFFECHPQLKSFKVTQSPRFDVACIESLVTNCTLLQELKLKEIGQMDDSFLTFIAQWGAQMLYLDLSDPESSCSERGLENMLKAIGLNLTHLDLSGHNQITDSFLETGIKVHCHAITSLVLKNIPELSDDGVAKMFGGGGGGTARPKRGAKAKQTGLKQPLQLLDLSRNHELSSDALEAIIAHSGKSLQELNINGWKTTSEASLTKIGKTAKGLKQVDVGWCREVNDFVVQEMIQGCEKLSEVKLWGCNRVTPACPKKRGVRIRGIESQSVF